MEPRLYSKLRPKFRELLVDQKAKSVEFELIKAIVVHFREEDDKEIRRIAFDKLQTFLSSKDANRNYLSFDSV